MKPYLNIFETCIDRYARQLPWGIYLYHLPDSYMKHYGKVHKSRTNDDTEKYICNTIAEICRSACEYKRVYTETSPSGLVYIAVPLFMQGNIWAILASYLCLGREGTWRRSLNRGFNVSEAVDLLKELGFILETHQEISYWFNPRFHTGIGTNSGRGNLTTEKRDQIASPKF